MPDAYEPCTCGSGKKYKFCCRKKLRATLGLDAPEAPEPQA